MRHQVAACDLDRAHQIVTMASVLVQAQLEMDLADQKDRNGRPEADLHLDGCGLADSLEVVLDRRSYLVA